MLGFIPNTPDSSHNKKGIVTLESGHGQENASSPLETQKIEKEFNPKEHLQSIQERIMSLLDADSFFNELSPDDSKDLLAILNKDQAPNRILIASMFRDEILRKKRKMFSVKRHSTEELKGLYLTACKQFNEKIKSGQISYQEFLGVNEGDSSDAVQEHYRILYDNTQESANKTGLLTLTTRLISNAANELKKSKLS